MALYREPIPIIQLKVPIEWLKQKICVAGFQDFRPHTRRDKAHICIDPA